MRDIVQRPRRAISNPKPGNCCLMQTLIHTCLI